MADPPAGQHPPVNGDSGAKFQGVAEERKAQLELAKANISIPTANIFPLLS